jgi:hypothetical protein
MLPAVVIAGVAAMDALARPAHLRFLFPSPFREFPIPDSGLTPNGPKKQATRLRGTSGSIIGIPWLGIPILKHPLVTGLESCVTTR